MKKINRRELILGGASLVALGGAAAYTRYMRSKPVVRETGPEIPAFIPERDLEGLTHPMTAYAKIGNVELSRLILGGNYGRLVKAYFTDERVFRNFRIAEACGVNTILTNPALMRVINRYWREEGGKIKFISDCGYPGGVIKGAIASVENGASMVYCHGGHADTNAVVKKDWKFFREYLDESRKLGVPVGIGCHSLQTVKFCVEHDCIPDFWMKTVHKVDYPTAHLNEDKRKDAAGLGSCDNRFVDTTREEVFAYMASRPEPWIAFKVLGAGIEHPRDAFPVSWTGGADFICCGMYDYQVVEDVNVANAYFDKGLPERSRPWHG